MSGCGKLIAKKQRTELKEEQLQLDEVHMFLEEDLHNFVLQEEAPHCKLNVHEKKCIARRNRVHAHLQWSDEEYMGSKFYFDYLKCKASSQWVLGF